MIIRLTTTVLCLTALYGCASSPDAMTEDQRDDAMAECFEQFENYPTQLNRCINDARTVESAETPAENNSD